MSEIKEVSLKYIPTGIVFKMPEQDAVEIMKTDRGNYEAVDFVFPEEKPLIETTTFEQVVEEQTEEETEKQTSEEKDLNALKVSELVAYCDENEIEYSKDDKKADLIAKIIKAENETTTFEQVVEN